MQNANKANLKLVIIANLYFSSGSEINGNEEDKADHPGPGCEDGMRTLRTKDALVHGAPKTFTNLTQDNRGASPG
jgi:hypothetical protein